MAIIGFCCVCFFIVVCIRQHKYRKSKQQFIYYVPQVNSPSEEDDDDAEVQVGMEDGYGSNPGSRINTLTPPSASTLVNGEW